MYILSIFNHVHFVNIFMLNFHLYSIHIVDIRSVSLLTSVNLTTLCEAKLENSEYIVTVYLCITGKSFINSFPSKLVKTTPLLFYFI